MITLNEQEVNDLLNFANEMPTKFGLPIVNFLTSKLPKQEEIKEEVED